MNWKQPRNPAQWMLLCAPAVAGLLALWGANVWMSPVPRLHLQNGAEVVNIGAILRRDLLVLISAMTVASIPLALAHARGELWLARLGNTLGLTLLLVFFNSCIALGGCAAVSAASNMISR